MANSQWPMVLLPFRLTIIAMAVALKRAYEKPSLSDGTRVLVDRLWPRGLSKEKARIDLWLRELAPSKELGRWFHTRPAQWPMFRKKYLRELNNPEAREPLEKLYELADKRKNVTLVFSSRNADHNNAVVLKELLEGMRKPPNSTGPLRAAAGAVRARRTR